MTRLLHAATLVVVAMAFSAAAQASVQSVETAWRGTIPCLVGGSGRNVIVDDRNVNCLIGRSGTDLLKGLAGRDLIDAESSDLSSDTIYGGANSDTYYVGPAVALGDPRIDRIMDMTAGESICARVPFTSWRRASAGGANRWIVVNDVTGGEVVIAWVADLGSKQIQVLPCYLVNE